MTPRLGLVCISASEDVRFKTITRTRLHALSKKEQSRKLSELYLENAWRLDRALDFCAARGISLYRLSSALFPFSDEPVGQNLLQHLHGTLARTGEKAASLGIRLVMHPDQFVVLSSDSPQVVENSIKILEAHARTMDLLKQPRSPWAVIEIHGGKRDRIDSLIEVYRGLSEPVRSRLGFENDEYSYGADEILELCHRTGAPMIFDAHHHMVHEGLEDYEHESYARILREARDTWPDRDWQLTHISNGKARFGDRSHSDLIETMPSAYREAPWIEIEAKLKEEAIAALQKSWLKRPLAAA